MAASDDKTEVRFNVPNDVLSIIDALSFAHNLERGQMLNSIVRDWAKKRVMEARMVHKVARIKPESSADSAPSSADWFVDTLSGPQ
jgi:hypothetical protein